MKVVTLYRPVGQREFELVKESGFRKFPPRLDWQPIWDIEDELSGYASHALAFDLQEDYLSKYPIHNVGGGIRNELSVPA